MMLVCEKNKCNGCMVCVSNCPKQCISINDKMDSLNAEIDDSQCINCNLCKKLCPNNTSVTKKQPIEWKQGWAIPEIRNNSTSGGAASAIIKSFIQSGGFVASCLFKEGDFVFEITNDIDVAKKFAGSKYVKSNPYGIYKVIQERLKTDKVLFIGLPCQVAALRNFIKNQENLYTIDILCHGTPSIKVLKSFFKDNRIDISQLDNVKFRTDATTTPLEKTMDVYSIAFLNGMSCTENCYSCNYTSSDRISDISLGDSWGTEFKEEEKNGVSLILVQSEKGKRLLDNANLELMDVNYQNAINHNQPLREHIKMPKGRKIFFTNIKKGVKVSVALCMSQPRVMMKQKLKRVLTILGIKEENDKYRISVIKKCG